jgi:DNA-binding Xre family transcriptional regulator
MYTPADYVRFKQIYIALPRKLEQMQELAKQIGVDQSQLAVLIKQKGDRTIPFTV